MTTCATFHNWLLNAERPDRPPRDMAEHLRSCATCRVWQRRLITLENEIPQMPLPASERRSVFVQDFIGGMPLGDELESLWAFSSEDAASKPVISLADPKDAQATQVNKTRLDRFAAAFMSALDTPRAKLRGVPAPARSRVATVLAATLLLFAFTFWSTGPLGPLGPAPAEPVPPADPFLAKVVQHEMRLANAPDAKVKVLVLADLADDLHDTQDLAEAAPIESLDKMAQLYKKVADSLAKQAETLSEDQREEVLDDIVARLQKSHDKARDQAIKLSGRNRDPHIVIATAADQCGHKLIQLLGRKS